MRNAFINELVKLARIHPHIALVVGDLGYSVIEPFADEFPDRFINAGVAEQNMTGLAAGMASEGYHVFTYSIANFPTFRCAEQIRNDVAYHNLPVTVVAVGGGLAYGALGYSHHAVQDFSLMRAFPNMLIAAPGDPFEVRACLRYLVSNPGPSYLRLAKAGDENFHTFVPEVSPGKCLKIRDGYNKSALISTGSGLKIANRLLEKDEYSNNYLFSMPLWGMLSKKYFQNFLENFENIITVEEHLYDGGFGSWVLEANSLNSNINCKINPIALSSDVCELVASQDELVRIGLKI